MSNEMKYDVALSFAEENKDIAESIAVQLKERGLKSYFYKFENAENWGGNLFNILIDRYKESSKLALVLISKDYVRKRWANIERQLIQTVIRNGDDGYLLPLSLDGTKLEGLTDNTLYQKWKNNPEEIADMLEIKLKSIKKKEKKKEKKRKKKEKPQPQKIGTQFNIEDIKDNKNVTFGNSNKKISTKNYTEKGDINE